MKTPTQQGIHLLEMLIILTMIGLLATIGLASYSPFPVQQKRLAAEVFLVTAAIALEHYFIEHHTYHGATLEKLKLDPHEIKNHYQFLIQSGEKDYVLKATPIHQQANLDKECGSLMLNALGEKTLSGSGTFYECWY